MGLACPATRIVFLELVHQLVRTELLAGPTPGGSSEAKNGSDSECSDDCLVYWPAGGEERLFLPFEIMLPAASHKDHVAGRDPPRIDSQ